MKIQNRYEYDPQKDVLGKSGVAQTSTRAYFKGGLNAKASAQIGKQANRQSTNADPDATKVYPKAWETTAA